MTALFTILPDSFAILRSSGVYRQAKLFSRVGFVYAAHGSGFIRLSRSGTTIPKVSIADLVLDFTPAYNNVGWLIAPTQETTP
tara:strand:- start:36905 stop:37153 length:249 start_codon:yes stop_codon:yes gene_type:complete